jgi:hypothetical protein
MSSARDALQAPTLPANAAWQKALGGRETAAKLEQLPAGLMLGDDLGEPIWYDPQRRLLVYRGFMCNASYGCLRRLSGDAAYLVALEQLYLGSANDDPPRRGSLLLRVAGPLALVMAAVGTWLALR